MSGRDRTQWNAELFAWHAVQMRHVMRPGTVRPSYKLSVRIVGGPASRDGRIVHVEIDSTESAVALAQNILIWAALKNGGGEGDAVEIIRWISRNVLRKTEQENPH